MYDNTKIHNVDALDTYKWQYMTMKKHSHQSIADFYQQFQAHVQMCDHEVKSTQQIYISTVTENKQKYSQIDVKRADGVRALQKVIGHPTTKQISYLLDHHLIPNSPFTSHDV